MFDFHYKYIKPKSKEKVQLLFTDTDSSMYEIETEFTRIILKMLKKTFDTSNVSNHSSGIQTVKNKTIIGMFKK